MDLLKLSGCSRFISYLHSAASPLLNKQASFLRLPVLIQFVSKLDYMSPLCWKQTTRFVSNRYSMQKPQLPVSLPEFMTVWQKCLHVIDVLVMEQGYEALTAENICKRAGLPLNAI